MRTVLDDISLRAHEAPRRVALAFTQAGAEASVTYGDLLARAEVLAGGMAEAGCEPGSRIVLACPPSPNFYAMALAVVGSGMQLVLIDGGMNPRRLLGALYVARPKVVIAETASQLRMLSPPERGPVRRWFVDDLPTGPRTRWGDGSDEDTVAVVSFTSGSTGRAKGVVRTHGILLAQNRALSAHLPYRDGDVDMTCFPVVVLHNLACGVTTVLPPIDLREPGQVDPGAVCDVVRRHGVSTISAAPAFVEALADHGDPLPSVRRIAVGGGPVPRPLCAKIVRTFMAAETLVVYGSTEAEPIAHVTMADVLRDDHPGLLVGTPVEEVDVALVDLPARLDRVVPAGWIRSLGARTGEVVVRGAVVSRVYVGDPEAVATNKVRESDGTVWHRTGDIAQLDPSGRLRLLGHTADVVRHAGRDLHPLMIEAALAEVPGVRRTALVAHRGAPGGEVAVVVAVDSAVERVRERLRTEGLAGLPVRVIDAIPTDPRHNSKVDRAALRRALSP
ncbi:AMP-binding protein [Longispora urticae]